MRSTFLNTLIGIGMLAVTGTAQAALIGVDFGGGALPTNWNVGPSSGSTPLFINNLIGEDGLTTTVDLQIDGVVGSNISSSGFTPNAGHIPTHSQSLTGLNGITVDAGGITITLSDLIPAATYELWLFGGSNANNEVDDVTILHGGANITFTQNIASTGDMWVNGSIGSNAALSTFAETVTATASGTVTINIVDGGANGAGVAGIALLPNSYAITETANPAEGGSVSCTPNPVDDGSSASCTATANTGYTFVDWSGDCTGAGACGLSNVTTTQSVTANFILNSHAVSTSAAGTGSGTTGGDGSYDFGTTVNLTATASPGSTFINWSGHALCAASFTMPDEPVSCTATFTLNNHAVSTSAAGTGSGTTGGDGSYDFGTTVNLTATASPGSTFIDWSGHALCAASFTMPDEPVSCTATFTLNSHAVTTSTVGGTFGSGTTGGDGTYDFGSTVNLTATASPGSMFIDWSGHALCAASFTMPDEPVSCEALFGQEVQTIPVLSVWGLTGLTGLLGLFGIGALRRRA